jgi:hypothetical protein
MPALASMPDTLAVLSKTALYFKCTIAGLVVVALCLVLTVMLSRWALVGVVLGGAAILYLSRAERSGWIYESSVLLGMQCLTNDFCGWGSCYPDLKRKAIQLLDDDPEKPSKFWLDFYLPRRANFSAETARSFGPQSTERDLPAPLNFMDSAFETADNPPMRPCFTIGEYRLGDSLSTLAGLVEFSSVEYAAIGRQFKGEIDYTAKPASFLGCSWNVQLQSVDGRICKIAPYIVLPNKEEANPIAMRALGYCTEQFGQPVEQKTGLFMWHTTDGNVVLQTGETKEGWVIGLFVTSRSIRDFERL